LKYSASKFANNFLEKLIFILSNEAILIKFHKNGLQLYILFIYL
jgi:hypothetical protein